MIQVAWRPSDGRIPLQAAGANLRDATKVRRPEDGFMGELMMGIYGGFVVDL
jgi:hypothetical protein